MEPQDTPELEPVEGVTEEVTEVEQTPMEKMEAAYDALESEGEDVTPGEETEAVEVAPEPAEVDSLSAPEAWGAEAIAMFAEQPRTAQEFLLERHKAMEGDYTRKTQAAADERRAYEQQLNFAQQAQQVLQPLAQGLASQGIDQLGALRQAAHYLDQYYQNPEGTIRLMAQHAGIEIPQREEDEIVDPVVRELQEKQAQSQQAIQALAQQREHEARLQQEYQQQAMYSELNETINSFAQVTDENGNLAHPHFERVQPLIGTKMQQAAAENRALSIEDAYSQVVAELNLQAPKTPEQEKAEAEAARRERVKKAKLAASGGSSSGMPSMEGLSSMERLAVLYDQLEAG